jgi:hypothetical protein
LHHGCGRLCHDQRYLVVDAIAAEPVVAAELQRQPGLAGRLAIAGWCTVAGFRVALG